MPGARGRDPDRQQRGRLAIGDPAAGAPSTNSDPTPGELLAAALGYARRGWPVFPCAPGRKTPLTAHGVHDATADAAQIRAWWTARPDANVAIATGTPGPDALDVDVHPAGDGWAALARLRQAGLLVGASRLVRTRSGGLHIYFQGTAQRNGGLREHHVDFRSRGGYVIAPPSWVDADGSGPGSYTVLEERVACGQLDWRAVRDVLAPPPRVRLQQPLRAASSADGGKRWAAVLRHVAGLRDGDERWRQIHWAAARAAELGVDPEAAERDLLAAAAACGFTEDKGERQAVRKIKLGYEAGSP